MHEVIAALAPQLPAALAKEVLARHVAVGARVEAGRAAHPELRVDDAAWAGLLARELRELQPAELDARLATLHAGDVHLMLACTEPARPVDAHPAHAKLDARLRGVAAQALAGIRLGAVTVDDVLQAVRTKLLVGEEGPGKLATYGGHGPLDGWLRVVVTRAALSLLRVREPDAATSFDDSPLLLHVGDAQDPQLELLRARAEPLLQRALLDALAALPAESRTLLRLHLVDQLTIDDLAALYQAHRATLARRLARARTELFEDARARARALLGVGETEFASLMGGLVSQLDLTLRTALASSDA